MSQIFHHSTNVLSRLSIYGGVFIIALLGAALYGIELSPWYTDVNVSREQPVPFSHKHHAGELGIDCRYCHTSVEKSSFAGVPPTQTCMTCHSQIWTNSSMLEPCARELSRRQIHLLDASERASRFRLFRSQHSREQRDWLHHLPWASRRDASHVSRRHAVYVLVPRLPSAAGKVCAPEITSIQSELRSARKSRGVGTTTRERLQHSQFAELFRVSPMTPGKRRL